MKRLMVVMGIMVLCASQAWAFESVPGGYIYWNGVDSLTGAVTNFSIWRTEIDNVGNVVGTAAVNIDNVANINAYDGWAQNVRGRNLEVLDPRSSGGSGNLLLSVITNNTPPPGGYSGPNYYQPWDTMMINPTTLSHTLLSDGAVGGQGGALPGPWDSEVQYTVLAAPQNWVAGQPSNGISLASVSGYYSNAVAALYDSNGDGVVDATEGTILKSPKYGGQWPMDSEFGPDGAVYQHVVTDFTIGLNNNNIRRTTSDGVSAAYYTAVAGDGIGTIAGLYGGGGIAVGPGNDDNAASIVYLFTRHDHGDGTINNAIFALQDVDGDNVVLGGGMDLLQVVWEQGDAGISIPSQNEYANLDIEIFVDPATDQRTLFFNTYYSTNVYALSLTADGLGVVGTGKVIPVGIDQGAMNSRALGFELDMTGEVVPEPATLLLVGTGVMGLFGFVRRRRK